MAVAAAQEAGKPAPSLSRFSNRTKRGWRRRLSKSVSFKSHLRVILLVFALHLSSRSMACSCSPTSAWTQATLYCVSGSSGAISQRARRPFERATTARRARPSVVAPSAAGSGMSGCASSARSARSRPMRAAFNEFFAPAEIPQHLRLHEHGAEIVRRKLGRPLVHSRGALLVAAVAAGIGIEVEGFEQIGIELDGLVELGHGLRVAGPTRCSAMPCEAWASASVGSSCSAVVLALSMSSAVASFWWLVNRNQAQSASPA